jgi:hypothetical protein
LVRWLGPIPRRLVGALRNSMTTRPCHHNRVKTSKRHARTAIWLSPIDFRRSVDGLHKRCRSRDFKSPHRKFLLDAWTLAEFVRHKAVDEVRLASPSELWPVGYVKIGENVNNVEATIALMPGRRMFAYGSRTYGALPRASGLAGGVFLGSEYGPSHLLTCNCPAKSPCGGYHREALSSRRRWLRAL